MGGKGAKGRRAERNEEIARKGSRGIAGKDKG